MSEKFNKEARMARRDKIAADATAIRTLLKIDLKSRFGYGARIGAGNVGKWIFNFVMTAGMYAVIVFLIYLFTKMFVLRPGLRDGFIVIVSMASVILQFFICTVTLIKALYYSGDNEILLRFPVNGTQIFIAKSIFVFISNFVITMAILLPFYISYGVILQKVGALNRPPEIFYPVSILTTFLSSFLPFFLANIVAIPLMKVMNLVKNNYGIVLFVTIAAVIGVCIQNPTLNMPAFAGFTVKGLDLFPILFVTIACGAVSGFHSLVSSGTSSKMISSEKDMRLVGYGSMCVEVVLGVVSLIVVCAAASNGVLPSGTPFQTFSGSVAAFLTEIFGVPHQIAACILTMCVSALALTSVDAVARIGRMSLQELFMPEPGKEKTAVQKLFTNTVFSTCLTLLAGYALCIAGYMSVWPLFGSANQLLSALVLTGLAVFLKSTGRKGWMLYAPMTIMFAVTMTALVQAVVRIIGAWMDGTFVWMIHGLQFVVAAALIVLALLVVYHCVLKLRDAAPIVKRD